MKTASIIALTNDEGRSTVTTRKMATKACFLDCKGGGIQTIQMKVSGYDGVCFQEGQIYFMIQTR